MTRLARLTTREADAASGRRDLLVVPLGSTEQHGPHLPLAVDTQLARALSDGLAASRPGTVVAPALPYGAAGEHQSFAGTVSIGADALELVLLELGRSACDAFPRLLFVSAHGGNARAVRTAVERLRLEGRDVRAWSPDWRSDAHAGRAETSLMLHLCPQAVRLELAVAGNEQPLADLLPTLVREGVASVAPNGVLGNPAGASAEEGARLLATAIGELSAWVQAWLAPAASE